MPFKAPSFFTFYFLLKGFAVTKSLLEIINLRKHYKTITALKGVSLTLHQGEIMCLLGVNGAGKTTLSSIVATLHPPTSGDILFRGNSIYNDVPSFRKKLGYCPQKPNLNPLLTLKDNLFFAGRYYGMHDTAIKVRIDELHDRLGIGEYLDRYSDELSGGWKQRYMLARTLLHEPELVIFDEPTVGLDPDIRHQLWYYIEHIANQGITVLLTTHYLEEAESLADRVCVLDKGLVKLIDTPQRLMETFKQARLEDVFIELTRKKE
jgi:ABC-2 type transport system ATP-binding protein